MIKYNKILIVGGSGFLGSNLADSLSNKGYKVGILDKKKSLWLKKNQQFYNCDISDENRVKKILKNYNFVYHFGDISDLNFLLKNPIISVNENIVKTVNFFLLCKEAKVKKILYSSSVYVNSSEGGFYKASKLSAEAYLKEFSKTYNLKYTILRFGSLYGPRSDTSNSLYRILYRALIKKKLYFEGIKNSEREFIHVHDAAQCCEDALNKNFDNMTLTITGFTKISMEKLLIYIKEILNLKTKPVFGNKKKVSHYEKTPYSFVDQNSIKNYSPNLRTDIGQGIIDLLKYIKKNPN